VSIKIKTRLATNRKPGGGLLVAIVRHHTAGEVRQVAPDRRDESRHPLLLRAHLGHVALVELRLGSRIRRLVVCVTDRPNRCYARTVDVDHPRQRDDLLYAGQVVEDLLALGRAAHVTRDFVVGGLGRTEIKPTDRHEGNVVPHAHGVGQASRQDAFGEFVDGEAGGTSAILEGSEHGFHVRSVQTVHHLGGGNHRVVDAVAHLQGDPGVEDAAEGIALLEVVDPDEPLRAGNRALAERVQGVATIAVVVPLVGPHHHIDAREDLQINRASDHLFDGLNPLWHIICLGGEGAKQESEPFLVPDRHTHLLDRPTRVLGMLVSEVALRFRGSSL
jgi:hypothetical protein